MKFKSVVMVPLMLGLVSCNFLGQSNSKKSNKRTVSTERLGTESDKDYAKKLTRIGEILVNNPVGMVHADDLFEQALAIDPSNNKAKFYSAFTKILMSMEGFAARAKDIDGDSSGYDRAIKQLNENIKYPEYVDYLKGNFRDPKFENYQDVKRFFQTKVTGAFDKAIERLESIDGDIELTITQLKTENTEATYDCGDLNDVEIEEIECEIDEPETMDSISALPAQISKVDDIDTKVIANGLRVYSAMLKLYTGYSIEGQKEITSQVQAKEGTLGRELTDKEMHEIILKYPNYITLEADHQTAEVLEDLNRITEAAMDLEALNNKYCDNDTRENNIIKVICVSEEESESIDQMMKYLSGPTEVSLGVDAQGNEVMVLMDLPTYLKNPLRDLKSLITGEYNDDGSMNMISEPELNGLFPNRDLLEKSKLVVDGE